MICIECGEKARVCDSRPVVVFGDPAVRRRHLCSCGNRFSTVEFFIDTNQPGRSMQDILLKTFGRQIFQLAMERLSLDE